MSEKRVQLTALLLAVVLILGACVFFCSEKSGMFIDEIYSYGLSNGYYTPFVKYIKTDRQMVGQTFTRQELSDYVTVSDNEGFNYGSVYYNQEEDVHPPLFYFLLHTLSSVFHGQYSKWIGLSLNLVFFALTLLILYRLVRKMGGSPWVASITMLLYGLSQMGLSTMLMIRMYMLLTMLTVLLAYLIFSMVQEFKVKYCVLSCVTIFAGLMTQYYFVFYAFFLCAAYVCFALYRKKFRELVWFVPSALLGVVAFVTAFPACINHLFADKLVSGTNALQNITAFSQYVSRLGAFVYYAGSGLLVALLVCVSLCIAIAVLLLKYRKRKAYTTISLLPLIVIIPAFFTLVLVAIISPVSTSRYIYNIAPIFAFTAAYLIYTLRQYIYIYIYMRTYSKALRIITIFLVAFLCCATLWKTNPSFLYPEHVTRNQIIKEHRNSSCVYFCDNYSAPITADLNQLLYFDEFYVTNTEDYPATLSYIGDSNEVVVFVDISEFWSSGYDPDLILSELMDSGNFQNSELLYRAGLSNVYLLSRTSP